MKREEIEQLQAVLDKFDRCEDVCIEKRNFLQEHGFNFEKQVMEVRRAVYHECFRELQKTLNRMKVEREHLLKDPIEVEVIDAAGHSYIPSIELHDYNKDVSLAKAGDKVKVIIVKEE